MVTVHATSEGLPEIGASISGYPVYLDTFALIDLARGDAARRSRFTAAVRSGQGGLLFSFTNAVEVAFLKGSTSDAVREFLGEMGPHWLPLELNPWEIVEREKRGQLSPHFAGDFLTAYYQARATDLSPGGSELLSLDLEFLSIGRGGGLGHGPVRISRSKEG